MAFFCFLHHIVWYGIILIMSLAPCANNYHELIRHGQAENFCGDLLCDCYGLRENDDDGGWWPFPHLDFKVLGLVWLLILKTIIENSF